MLTFLMIGAHPDDMDLRASGLAMRLTERGHKAVFLSVTNGNAGHMTMEKEALRLRRRQEMADAAAVFGLQYDGGYSHPRKADALHPQGAARRNHHPSQL